MRLALLAAAILLPVAVLAAPPPDLVFTVCRVDDPAECREARVPIDDLAVCRNGWDAQFLMVRWLDEHPPGERRGSYECRPAERGA